MQQIATDQGIDKSTVCRRLNADEVREYIETAREQLITRSLPKAISNLNNAIDGYSDPETSPQKIEHGYKASVLIAQAANILPSATTNTINVSGNAIITPAITSILQSFGKALSDNVIDVTDSLPEVNTAKES